MIKAKDLMKKNPNAVPDVTPLEKVEVKSESDKGPKKQKIMIYCRLDKRVDSFWSFNGGRPTKPHIDGDWFYGKGCADAGYSTFCALLAVKNL